jgi:predicted dinucleotide-binding enzyme
MKVTIVGAGNMGRGIGTRAVAGGHQVEIVDHDPAEAGKVVVDITNPVDTQTWDSLATPPGTSSAEEVAQLVADGGLRPLDVGPLARAQQLEQLGFLHISLQQQHDLGFASAIKLHS